MEREKWRARIVNSCNSAGTYQPCFDDVIETLAAIMERRDEAQEAYEKDGRKSVVEQETSTGGVKTVKNPFLLAVNELDSAALAYWRDLGLTPKGFQSMQKNGFQKKEGTFEELLKNIGI